MFTEKFSCQSWLFSKNPLRWGETSNRRLRVDLGQDVGESLLDTICASKRKVMHENLNRLPQDLVTAFNHRKASVCLPRRNFMSHIVLCGPFSKVVTAPTSAFISPKASRGTKMSHPASLHGMDEVFSSLSHDHSSDLILRGQIDHRQNGNFSSAILDPHDVSLNSFTKLLGLLESSRRGLVGFPIAKACHTTITAGGFNDSRACTSRLQNLYQSFGRWVAKVAVKTLNRSHCFLLRLSHELDQIASGSPLLINGHSMIPELSGQST